MAQVVGGAFLPALGLAMAVLGAPLRAQPVPAQPTPPAAGQQDPRQQVEGLPIRSIRIEGARDEEAVRRLFQTRVGEPLRGAVVAEDLRNLWKQQRYQVTAWAAPTPDGGVAVTFEVVEPFSYENVEFLGMERYTEQEARQMIDIIGAQRTTSTDADDHRRILLQRYRRDGYHYVSIQLEKDEETSTLRFVIDEGPEVVVREVHIIGNTAFPADALWGPDLIGGAELESKPANLIRGVPFSEEVVDEDVQRLQWFYRARGYRDARAFLAAVEFTQAQDEVDLTLRVIEGPRYKVRSVSIEHFDGLEPTAEHLYPPEEILARLQLKPGDDYDRDLVNRDKREIERYYGERGHPMQGRYGAAPLVDAFEWATQNWMQPRETFVEGAAEIDLVYQIVEGSPKTLRDVTIRGNTDTQDRVVRRRVQVRPGEQLDLSQVDRSIQLLSSLRYFNDPDTLVGPRFELRPVSGSPDVVDLEIEVAEGDTGSFIWGAGVSTGAGVQARFQLTKRNFDLFRLPSSPGLFTLFDEITTNKAFHGAGQELELLAAPGTEISTFRLSFYEPDLFRDHVDTIGLRVQGFRSIRILDSFDSDSRGLIVGLQRNFTESVSLGVSLRQETTEVESVDANAPGIVFDAEGQTEIRSGAIQLSLRDLDDFLFPSTGYDVLASAEIAGGLLGGEEDFYKLRLRGEWFHRLAVDELERPHVLHLRQDFEYGHAYSNTDDLFLTERFYMGGTNLRGFDQRRAGPTQFGRPLGGEAMLLLRSEYLFPLVSTRQQRAIREVELLRGVVFADAGLLGTGIDDASFGELRASVGFGLRIHVPILGVPIALDFGFPISYEGTDDRQVFSFSLSSR